MCGIVGVAGDISLKDKRIFKELLIIDSLRGPHSTGIASIAPNSTTILKRATLPHDLIDSNQWDKTITFSSHVLIGHNRYATTGRVNNNNAHPFEIGNIIGAHNGTLIDQTLLPDDELFEVDSENIIHSLNEQGVKETVENLYGSYALVYWNGTESTLNMIRNTERPLWMTIAKSGKTIYWASERNMLMFIVLRNEIEVTDPVSLEPNILTSFKIPKTGQKFTDPELTEIEDYIPPVTPTPTTNFGYGMGWPGQYDGDETYYSPHISRPPYRAKDNTPKRVSYDKDSLNDITKDRWVNFNPGEFNTEGYFEGYIDNKSMTECRVYLWKNPICERTHKNLLENPWLIHRGKVQKIHKDAKKKEGWISILPTTIALIEGDETSFVYGRNIYNNNVILSAWSTITKEGCFSCGEKPDYGEPITWWKQDKKTYFMCAPCTYEMEAANNKIKEHIAKKDVV